MIRNYFLLAIILLTPIFIEGQSISTEFGKNRVQYHDDFKKWWSYETENFITYWYGKGRNIAQSVIQMSEMDYDEIQNIMEHRINDKIEIIVFLDMSDMKQSNIGSEESFVSINDQTKTIGNKMFVYFDGNTKNLRNQIREGIANVFLNSMFSGGSLQELVQSAIKLNVPEWYERGIISYAGSPWDELIDDELRDIWVREDGKYADFEKISDEYPKIAGHSFWYFIDQLYGKATIANLLYLTRINRDLDESFLFVIGIRFEEIIAEWKSYYDDKYVQEQESFTKTSLKEELNLKNKQHAPVSLLRFSPDGNTLAYAYNYLGKYAIRIKSLETGEEKEIFKYGYKNDFQEIDFNYPAFAWHPSGNEITIVYEHRDKIRLRKVDLANDDFAEQIVPENFHRVYSIDYINDLEYLFAASTDGYSDLYTYNSKSRQDIRLTEDFYNDIDASYVEINGQMGALFSSNRTNQIAESEELDTILPLGSFNVFFFPFEEEEKKLQQFTFSKSNDNHHPVLLDANHVAYTNESSGIRNIFVTSIDASSPPIILTNLDRNIIRFHGSGKSDLLTYSLYSDEGYKTYLDTISLQNKISPYLTEFAQQKAAAGLENTVGIFQLNDETEEAEEEMKEGYFFQSEFEDPQLIEPLDLESSNQQRNTSSTFANFSTSSDKEVLKFVPVRAVAARTRFKLEDITTSLDNEILFEGLESFAGVEDEELVSAPMGILMKAKVKDLFEDYEVEAGIRIPTRFNGAEQFFVADNNKALIDHRFGLYRKAKTEKLPETNLPSQRNKRTALLGIYRARYPLDIYTSIRATTTLRFDKFFLLSSDAFSAGAPSDNTKRLGLKLEYVYDNTLDVDLNVKHGTRYKIFAEAINRFNVQFREGFKFDLHEGFTTVVGLDARHYIPFLKHGVIALRGAAAMSFGSEKILYYLGGVEGSVLGKFNQDIEVPQNINFAYKTVAPHLRGFDFNIRNGNSFALINTEIRIPIFKYFLRKSSRSNFFRNFQIVGFLDAGTAWHGLTPNGDDNPINSITIEQPPVLQVKVRYYKDPLVLGYGTGLRASLLGYFVRLDYAWGVESRTVQPPKFYFSIGTDF